MARSTSSDSPSNWVGTRTVIRMEAKCGWCITDDCANCNHELGYYEKLWICGCKCNVNWEPQAVVIERKETDEKTTKSNTGVRARKASTATSPTRTSVSSETESAEIKSVDSSS